MTDEFLASEASRLLNDRVLIRAVAAMRLDALEQITEIQPDDISAVCTVQARVFACDDFLGSLRRFIEAVGDD